MRYFNILGSLVFFAVGYIVLIQGQSLFLTNREIYTFIAFLGFGYIGMRGIGIGYLFRKPSKQFDFYMNLIFPISLFVIVVYGSFAESVPTTEPYRFFQTIYFVAMILDLVIFATIAYYFKHPFVVEIIDNPNSFFDIAHTQIKEARDRLAKISRLDVIISQIGISKKILDDAVNFREVGQDEKIKLIAKRVDAKLVDMGNYHELNLPENFPLFVKSIIVKFIESEDVIDIKNELKHSGICEHKMVLILAKDESLDNIYKNLTSDKTNIFITPKSTELTKLLLSPNPKEVFSTIVSSQIALTQISPFVVRITDNPNSFFDVAHTHIKEARDRLVKISRLDTIISQIGISKKILDDAVNFVKMGEDEKIKLIAKRVEAKFDEGRLDLPEDFPLSVKSIIVKFVESQDMIDIKDELKQSGILEGKMVLILAHDESLDSIYKNLTSDKTNMFITAKSTNLTKLLLSPNPKEVFSKIISSQIALIQISPYQVGGGVNDESIFFGRERE